MPYQYLRKVRRSRSGRLAVLGQAVKSAGIRNGNVALFSKIRQCGAPYIFIWTLEKITGSLLLIFHGNLDLCYYNIHAFLSSISLNIGTYCIKHTQALYPINASRTLSNRVITVLTQVFHLPKQYI